MYTLLALAAVDAVLLFGPLDAGNTTTDAGWGAIVVGLNALAATFIRSRVTLVVPQQYAAVIPASQGAS